MQRSSKAVGKIVSTDVDESSASGTMTAHLRIELFCCAWVDSHKHLLRQISDAAAHITTQTVQCLSCTQLPQTMTGNPEKWLRQSLRVQTCTSLRPMTAICPPKPHTFSLHRSSNLCTRLFAQKGPEPFLRIICWTDMLQLHVASSWLLHTEEEYSHWHLSLPLHCCV